MLIVKLDGLRDGNRGDRKGEEGVEPETEVLRVPVTTFKLKFFALRARLGGDDERCDVGSGYGSSKMVVVVTAVAVEFHSPYILSVRRCPYGSGSIIRRERVSVQVWIVNVDGQARLRVSDIDLLRRK
jgi:hypothetical protein